jgi:hypothetical protein
MTDLSDKQVIDLTQTLTVEMPAKGVHVIEKPRWDRIERRVMEELGGRSIDWLATGWAFFGMAVAAGVALLVLPEATPQGTHLSAVVRPTLWAVLIAGAVLWVVFTVFYFSSSKRSVANAHDICNEMRVARGADEEPSPKGAIWKLLEKLREGVRGKSPRTSPATSGALEVVRARYGPANAPEQVKDVTDVVRALVRDGRLALTADNGTLGGDPAEGVPKTLWIEYRSGGDAAIPRVFTEGEYLDLP